ncbi:hypothetical protein F5B22DRAFT_658720 [Xylaria bambusicola]|uniref:uncharacterized protein n=1 Tax=Xylaria bambusicola TaxID=326684 RepID=UPI002008C0E6|nr:uncharacterized protein F5B22DRAFT_658720 [Xylaria bambusicola]KAI0508927.1 hypothetical protein F5B22DRAFT_658720 [Xylaria bambusicola]
MADKTTPTEHHQDNNIVTDPSVDSIVQGRDTSVGKSMMDMPYEGANAINPSDNVVDGSEPVLNCNEASHGKKATVPFEQYEDLASKINELERKLGHVDTVVKRELVEPLMKPPLDGHGFWGDFDNDDFDKFYLAGDLDEELVDFFRTFKHANRELLYVLRATREQRLRRRQHYMERQELEAARKMAEKTRLDDNTTKVKQVSKADLLATLAAQMLEDGTPATTLRTPWEAFEARDPSTKVVDTIANPIELLIGEPEVAFFEFFDNFERESDDQKLGPRSLSPKGVDDKTPSEEAPLPERVLIYSKELLSILSDIHKGSMKADVTNSILRPFKMLVYYEKQIRDRAAALEAKFAHATNTGTEENPANTGNSEDDIAVNGSLAMASDQANRQSDGKDAGPLAALLHIRCLLEFLDKDIGAKKKHLRSTTCEKVTFSDIWYLFQPGEEVIDQDNKQAYRVLRVSTPKHRVISPFTMFHKATSADAEEKPAIIDCVYIDFDGEKLGPVTKSFSIPRFDQDKPVENLPIYPLRMVKGDDYRDRLIERGRMLWDVIKVKPMYYNGHTIDTKEEADSQVMIDFNEALIHARERNLEWTPKVETISASAEETRAGKIESSCRAACCRGQKVHDDSYVDNKQTEDFIKGLLSQTRGDRSPLIIYPRALREMLDSKSEPKPDELVVMCYRVFGFILRSQKWAQLDLTYLKYENEDNKRSVLNAFDSLVLPDGHKEMVKSLVTQHFRDKKARKMNTEKKVVTDARSDLIRGKGQGLIILLHGAPGVGKTTTAEGVAELFHKPLFQVTCGDLGTTAFDVQRELEKNFTLASRWDCILLLDEAEVFLTSRERKDFIRNGLVAVFLRVLEYYTGILFLTTNRVGDFDEAFASRIQMSLHYPKLDLDKTLRVFKVNLDLIEEKFKLQNRKIYFEKKSILDFAEKHFNDNNKRDDNNQREKEGLQWNGRQIRNVCQTALAMAEYEALNEQLSADIAPSEHVHLRTDHFSTIEAAYDEFAIYLSAVYGVDLEERAGQGMARAEAWKLEKRRERLGRVG